MPERNDVARIIDLLEKLRVKERLQGLLESVGAHYSGTWDIVRQRALDAYDEGKLTYAALVDLVDEVEAYGRQHVFLYKVPDGSLDDLTDRARLERALAEMAQDVSVLDEPRIVIAPTEPALCAVRASGSSLEVKYVETRTYWELLDEEESDDGDERHLTKTFVARQQRAAVILAVDGDTGHAELRVATLPRGSNYKEVVARYAALLRPILRIDGLPRIDLTAVVKLLFDHEEVRRRRGGLETDDGCSIDITSAGDGEDFHENEFYEAGRGQVGDDFGGSYVHVYWLPAKSGGGLTDEVGSYVYARNEVAFPASATKEQVCHVLARLRRLASA